MAQGFEATVGLPYRTHSIMLAPLCNMLPLEYELICRCANFMVLWFYRVSQKVSDVIPVLRLTPIGTQPSAVSVFLSVSKCGGLQSHM